MNIEKSATELTNELFEARKRNRGKSEAELNAIINDRIIVFLKKLYEQDTTDKNPPSPPPAPPTNVIGEGDTKPRKRKLYD